MKHTMLAARFSAGRVTEDHRQLFYVLRELVPTLPSGGPVLKFPQTNTETGGPHG